MDEIGNARPHHVNTEKAINTLTQGIIRYKIIAHS